ncbi:hypothetical protein DFH09DRAFT_1100439 [Mycena vulgaris]|nr:hypothetical protein DFH09DRAFT_1100439 [Mycena vulgaris]
MTLRISSQGTNRLFGPLNRPDLSTNVRHRAILRKALELFSAHELETTFGTPTKLRVVMGNMCTLGQLGKIQSNIMRNDRLVRRETPAPDLPARQALIAYRTAYDVYFKTNGNAYAVRNPHAKYVLQDAEQTWHDWVVPYLATRGRPGRPTWALQPLPGFQRVRVVPAHPRAPAPRAATPRAATATVQTPSRRRTQFALPTPSPSSPVRTPAAHPQVGSRMQPMQHNFILVLQRLADLFFADSVPDIYKNFLAITRFHQELDIIMRRGHAHGVEDPLPGEADRPYPNRPRGYLGLLCAACPERGVNMPLAVNVPRYLRHLISQFLTLDGNFKANLFYKRDDGSDKALTDGRMYFLAQNEYDRIAKEYVVQDEDKEVPCKAHIGSIRHQGSVKYGNTAVSGVVACACDHAVVGSFVDMLKGEAFALGTYAQRENLKRYNSPPHGPASYTPTVCSYDSWCSFCVNLVQRAVTLFPEETWLHTLLASVEGQIPADHINGHGLDCQTIWQAVHFACRAHFHGETAEVIWAFLNPLGSSTRQSNGAARHDIINFVIDAWNWLKVLRQAQLLADERLDSLRLFEHHMAVVEDLSRQHTAEVADWSRLSRLTTKSAGGKPRSVYQHESTRVLTVENVLAAMLAEEHEKSTRENGQVPKTRVAKWIHDGMRLERQQYFLIALLQNHREHPLEETWATITKLRDSLNLDLKKFRETQLGIYPRLKLSALGADEPELTAIQLPSYRMKHGQRAATGLDANDEDSRLREAEITLWCSEATSGILAVRAASLALSAVKKARDLDYRGQAGISRSQRNL